MMQTSQMQAYSVTIRNKASGRVEKYVTEAESRELLISGISLLEENGYELVSVRRVDSDA